MYRDLWCLFHKTNLLFFFSFVIYFFQDRNHHQSFKFYFKLEIIVKACRKFYFKQNHRICKFYVFICELYFKLEQSCKKQCTARLMSVGRALVVPSTAEAALLPVWPILHRLHLQMCTGHCLVGLNAGLSCLLTREESVGRGTRGTWIK